MITVQGQLHGYVGGIRLSEEPNTSLFSRGSAYRTGFRSPVDLQVPLQTFRQIVSCVPRISQTATELPPPSLFRDEV